MTMDQLWMMRNIPKTKLNQLEKKGIHTVMDLLTYYPKSYKFYELSRTINEGDVAFIMHLQSVKSYSSPGKTDVLIATGISHDNIVTVSWFHQNYLLNSIQKMVGRNVIVAGQCTYDNQYDKYVVYTPVLFDTYDERKYPGEIHIADYPKVPGMSQDYLVTIIRQALKDFPYSFPTKLPASIQEQLNLLPMHTAAAILHDPVSRKVLNAAQRRMRAEKMFIFSSIMLIEDKDSRETTSFRIKNKKMFNDFIQNLPYALTCDQEKAVQDMYKRAASGRPIRAMVQGDVGCGKSIIAFALMVLFCSNGWQCALMAPTKVLAEQHYNDLRSMLEPYGIKPLFVPSLATIKKKAKEKMLYMISSGEAQILVGTHALLSDEIIYKNLALIVIDEEHKFGVEQRQKMQAKAEGVHSISMSATPIPRSLASVIYGEKVQLHLIQSMPPGRVPIQTAISSSYRACFKFLHKQISEGRQAYIVCPQITGGEEQKGNTIASVEELIKIYQAEFGEDHVCALTGKTKKTELAKILEDFKENRRSILIATTVIEVGVNVPNASTIIIHNAERYGLATLHQLRGRVGRGGGKAYCVLFSEERDNERLQIMCQTTDGFKIAEADLKNRGAGDLFGTEQSGMNEYVNLILDYPEEYQMMKNAVTSYFTFKNRK